MAHLDAFEGGFTVLELSRPAFGCLEACQAPLRCLPSSSQGHRSYSNPAPKPGYNRPAMRHP